MTLATCWYDAPKGTDGHVSKAVQQRRAIINKIPTTMSDGSDEADVSMEDTAPSRDECERNELTDDQLNLIDLRLQGNVS